MTQRGVVLQSVAPVAKGPARRGRLINSNQNRGHVAHGQGQVPDVFQWRGDMSGKPLSSLEGYVTQSGAPGLSLRCVFSRLWPVFPPDSAV